MMAEYRTDQQAREKLHHCYEMCYGASPLDLVTITLLHSFCSPEQCQEIRETEDDDEATVLLDSAIGMHLVRIRYWQGQPYLCGH